MLLAEGGRAVARTRSTSASNALGRKLRAGDLATPEGRYRVVAKKGPGQSRYHKALLLDYPNEADRRRIAEARRAGELPPGSRPGGLIEIHGEGGLGRNWTDGCVAVSNADMDELFAKVELGAWVTIVGGDGTNGAFSGFAERSRRSGRIGGPAAPEPVTPPRPGVRPPDSAPATRARASPARGRRASVPAAPGSRAQRGGWASSSLAGAPASTSGPCRPAEETEAALQTARAPQDPEAAQLLSEHRRLTRELERLVPRGGYVVIDQTHNRIRLMRARRWCSRPRARRGPGTC